MAQPKIKLIKLSDVVCLLRLKYGINTCVLGMKKADGMNRRLMMCNLPQPVRYSLAASSGVGFNEACFTWLEKNCPEDLEKIYKVFPLSRRVLFEYHQKEKAEFLEKCKMDNDE